MDAEFAGAKIDRVHLIGTAPRCPATFVGRMDDLKSIKSRLGVGTVTPKKSITVITGWPGVGKTTFTSYLSYQPDVLKEYPDGVLWTSLGTNPNALSNLAAWGRALGNAELLKAKSPQEASDTLRAMLRSKRMLLIVDDVWTQEDGAWFKVGGQQCATLITTRDEGVANALAPTKDDKYLLGVMPEPEALELIDKLTSGLVQKYPKPCHDLVVALEYLPLSLQVAGHLLNIESSRGFDVEKLTVELQDGKKILLAQAPEDREDQKLGLVPSVYVLLAKSVERLDDHTRECFAELAVFASKPATFEINAMAYVWEVADPKPIVATLIDRGLLELVPEDRYWMHAILAAYARFILNKM